jgi:hypothetical protein
MVRTKYSDIKFSTVSEETYKKLVSFEVAKLIKEKNIQIPSDFYYMEMLSSYTDEFDEELRYNKGDIHLYDGYMVNNIKGVDKSDNDAKHFSAIRLNDIVNYFWDEKGIFIEVTLWGDGIGFMCILKKKCGKEEDGSTIIKQIKPVETRLSCFDHREVLNRGIEEAIKEI